MTRNILRAKLIMIHAVNYIASSVSDICKECDELQMFVCLFVCLTIAQRQVNLEEEKVVPY